MTHRTSWLAFSVLLCLLTESSAQEPDSFTRRREAIAAAIPGQSFSIWEATTGDLDGDHIADLAAVVVLGANRYGLVVLKGAPDGSYKPLSVSTDFCAARKLYNLDIGDRSLSVQSFSASDASGSESTTLQFRYSAALNDLELVGREEAEVNHDKDTSYRIRVNYLTRTILHARKAGARHKEVTERLRKTPLLRLQGFECSNYDPMDATLFIDDNFRVERR